MTSPAPNPYEASRAPEVPGVPRPPGRPAVWLWAVFALALGSPTALWDPFLRSLFEDKRGMGLIGAVSAGTALLGLLWSYLSDRYPLMGSRREGYLVLGCSVTVVVWAVAPFVPARLVPWLAIEVALGVGVAISRAATDGALVELARRHRAPGRLAAAVVGLGAAAVWMTVPIFTLLSNRPLGRTAAMGAVLALSTGMAAILAEDARVPAPDEPIEPRQPLFRSRTFWAALAFLTFARLLGLAQSDQFLIDLGREAPTPSSPDQIMLGQLVMLGVAVAYAPLSLRLSSGALLRLSVVARAAGFATWLWTAPSGAAESTCQVVRALADACMMIAPIQLILLAPPRGREALAYSLLLGLPVGLATALGTLVLPGLRVGTGKLGMVAVCICGSLLLAAAVSLLPPALRAGRDGQRVV